MSHRASRAALAVGLAAALSSCSGGGGGTGTPGPTPQPTPQPVPLFGLDDTGVTACATATQNGLPCADAASGTAAFPRQDADEGRDLAARDDADGHAGFSFRKLDAAGIALADQSASYAAKPWSCLEDLVTGLTWEVHPEDGGLRDRRWLFSWYDGSGLGAFHAHGAPGGGTCAAAGTCDTEKYAAAVRTARLCGFSDWRLPTPAELLSLVDYGAPSQPLVDAAFLPDAAAEAYWTAATDLTGWAWTVDFAQGGRRTERPTALRPVRLVRGGY